MKENKRPTIKNRKASFEYHLEQHFTAGMVLTGAEIKSVREGKVNISDAYCTFTDKGLVVRNMHISPYELAGYAEQNPLRDRVLLLQKNELKKLQGKLKDQGYSIIPVQLFFAESGYAKLEIALAKGKKTYDKREDIKQKDIKRDLERY